MDLFINPTLQFEKIGMEAHLSDNQDTWPQEALQELTKQHPYLGRFEIFPMMEEVDGEKGFGLGFFAVSNSTERPDNEGGMALAKQEGVRIIKIPIIIENKIMKNLDVFLDADGRPLPLNEDRVREALFRPQIFDSVGKPPAAAFLTEQLAPPERSRGSYYIPTETNMPKAASVLEALLPTISKQSIQNLTNRLEKDAELTTALLANEKTASALRLIASAEPLSPEDIGACVAQNLPHTEAVMSKEADGYHFLTSNYKYFSPRERVYDRLTMVKVAGSDLVETVDNLGMAAISTDPVVHEGFSDMDVKSVEDFGEYRVKSLEGKEHLGWVFPSVLDYDGVNLPISVFTNGSICAIQGQIAGISAGKSTNIVRGPLKGYGFFYQTTPEGSVIAFVPSHVITKGSDQNGMFVVVETIMGDVRKLRPINAKTIVKYDKDTIGIPETCIWSPLGDISLKLIENAESFVKTANMKHQPKMVEIVSDGNVWSFRGTPLNKLAGKQRELLNAPDATLLALSLGASPDLAVKQLVKAAKKGSALLYGCREIDTPKHQLMAQKEKAAALISKLPKKVLLLKEAATLDDADTIDKVLSIGFITPENVQTFIEFIPNFEKTVSKLSDLLIASRLGLNEISEYAVKSAMERLDEVISGLKQLMYRQSQA